MASISASVNEREMQMMHDDYNKTSGRVVKSITASVNEREIDQMHKDFNKPKDCTTESCNGSQDPDFFDNSNSQDVEMIITPGGKRRLEESEEEGGTSRSKMKVSETSAPQELDLPSLDSTVNNNSQINTFIPSATSVMVSKETTVILIKPTSENSKELINNPFEIVAAVEKSKFGRLNVNNIKINK